MTMSEPAPYPLKHTWHVYVVLAPKNGEKESAADYRTRIRELCRFSTVQEMWYVVNLLADTFRDYPVGVSVHVHRDGILPMWEEPANRVGGSLIMGFPKGKFVEVMEKVMMVYAGHQFEDMITGNSQYGTTGFSFHLNKRRFEHTFEVWTDSYSMSEGEIWEQGFRSFFRLMCGDCPREEWARQVDVERGEWFSTRVNWTSHEETSLSATIVPQTPQPLKAIDVNRSRMKAKHTHTGRSTPGFLV